MRLLGPATLFVTSTLSCAPATAPAEPATARDQTVHIEPSAEVSAEGEAVVERVPDDGRSVIRDDGLEWLDLRDGVGEPVRSGMRVSVHYTGTLLDGTVFDSTRERAPFTVPLGKGMLIRGFEDGVTGMRRGGLRRITIPPHLGYGERAPGKIPPGSTLVFEVELLDIE